MAFIVEKNIEGQYIFLKHSGELNTESGGQSRQEVIALLHATQWKRVFVDIKEVERGNKPTEALRLIRQNASSFPQGISIALLANMMHMTIARIAANVAANQGVNLRVFWDNDQAISWLRNQD